MDQTALSRTARDGVVRVCFLPALALLAGCATHTAPAEPSDADLVRNRLWSSSCVSGRLLPMLYA